MSSGGDLSGFSMLDLFRQEVAAQAAILTEGLLAIERQDGVPARLEALMRAAHSVKGAARIVSLEAGVRVAHALEDCFVAAQRGEWTIGSAQADVLLQGVDFLGRLAEGDAAPPDAVLAGLAGLRQGASPASPPASVAPAPTPPRAEPPRAAAPAAPPAEHRAEPAEQSVRVAALRLNRLLGMIGESLVHTRWMEPFAGSLVRLAGEQAEVCRRLEALASGAASGEAALAADVGAELAQAPEACRRAAVERAAEFDGWSRRSVELAERLYREAVGSRMRPFSDAVQGLPRMARDLARQLGKQARLLIQGEATQVDREILEKLEAPLAHLIRNALDHGVESPAERQAAGKAPEATVTVEARHRAGMLEIVVADDGRGVELERLRRQVVQRGSATAEMAAGFSEEELLEFLFLPGLSTAERVTEVSGRGVGLDIVRSLAQELGGSSRVETLAGAGTRVHLRLPVTLSVQRCLLVEVAGEPLAIPLMRIDQVVVAEASRLERLEGRPFLPLGGRNVGLAEAREVLALESAAPGHPADAWPVVVVSGTAGAYGFVADRFLGEQKLVVRPLDARLGKVAGVSAVSVMEDGSPVLILDTEDLLRLIQRIVEEGGLRAASRAPAAEERPRRRLLVVDDSITVREVERRLLEQHGYAVDAAVDGMDAWNNLRGGAYDLVVSDVDMPRLSGIELVRRIRQDARLSGVPVIIVSYKDRDEDRMQGLDAGANAYLTKSSFHDASLVKAVVDLIGEP